MATTVWKGHLTFGLVSFPVKLFTAARPDCISFNQLHKTDNSRIKQVIYCQAEDKPIPRSEIVKGYEYEKDRYVVIEDEDIKKMAPSTAKVKSTSKQSAEAPKTAYPKTWDDIDVDCLVLAKEDGPWRSWWEARVSRVRLSMPPSGITNPSSPPIRN